MKRPQKPEISYDHANQQCLRDGNPITFEEARAHWEAIDADWTMGAHAKMRELS